jgi:selenocysteine lyase/cysteine desulfurase
MSFKHLFQRSLAAAPDRLHFAAHSHHLWPDASWLGQQAAWDDAARLADSKWDRVMGEIWPAAQRHVAAELGLPDPSSIVFAGNTHDLLLRIVSARDKRPLRILTSDGEFHSFRRQTLRWVEAGRMTVDKLATGPGFAERLVEAAHTQAHDLIFVSQVMFGTGQVLPDAVLAELAALARPDGPWVVIDGYHGFMAIENDLSGIADRVFYLAGGYKYAMSGEGAAFMHCPPRFGPRPEITGWYAEFEDLSLPPGQVGYASDAMRFMGSTFDPSGIYRFVAVRDMLGEHGLTTSAINAHVAPLRAALLAGLADTPLADADLLNPGGEQHARFLAFRSPQASAWQAALAVQDIVTDVRSDVLRIGFGLYQDERDVQRILGVLRNLSE